METTIPFEGFYESIHNYWIENAIESFASGENNFADPAILDKISETTDYKGLYNAYAEAYTHEFAQKFNIELKFKLLSSPKYYNFETDKIICEIEFSEVTRIFNATDTDKLRKLIKDRCTSYDGFVSFYPNDLDRWPSDLKDWDLNHIGYLIEAYIAQETNSEDWETYLIDSPYEIVAPFISI